MELKEFAIQYPVLENWIKQLEELTEKVNRKEDFTKNLGEQAQRYDWIFACIWGIYMAGAITEQEKDELLKNLEELGRIQF